MKSRILVAALGLAGISAFAQAQDPNLARNLAATCANCHGTNGHAIAGADSLAGEPADKIYQTVMEFRSGDKPATIMHQISKGYTEEQLRLIADYFAAKK